MTLPRPLTRLLALAACATLAGGLAACGELQDETVVRDRDAVTVVLGGTPGAEHAAIYAADAIGAFDRAGLQVEIAPAGAERPLEALQAGGADFAVTSQTDLVRERDGGGEVQAVAALVQEPLDAVLSLRPERVRSARDLEGRTVGTRGHEIEAAYLDGIARAARIEPNRIRRRDVGSDVRRPLVREQVDAVIGSWNLDAVALERRRRPAIAVTRLGELAVPPHAGVMLAATEQTVRERGPVVRRLVQAIATGAKALRDDPATGLDPLVAATPGLDRGLLERSLEVTLPAMWPADDERPFGWVELDEWRNFAGWLQEAGLIRDGLTAARGFTTEYLPGEGVGEEDNAPPA